MVATASTMGPANPSSACVTEEFRRSVKRLRCTSPMERTALSSPLPTPQERSFATSFVTMSLSCWSIGTMRSGMYACLASWSRVSTSSVLAASMRSPPNMSDACSNANADSSEAVLHWDENSGRSLTASSSTAGSGRSLTSPEASESVVNRSSSSNGSMTNPSISHSVCAAISKASRLMPS